MSRIGKKPITIPQGVSVTVNGAHVTVKGPKGDLSRSLPPEMNVEVDGATVTVTRPSDIGRHRALHGLTRTLVNNMVEGVTHGFVKTLEIRGVGYKANVVRKEDLALTRAATASITLVASFPSRVYSHRFLVTAELLAARAL